MSIGRSLKLAQLQKQRPNIFFSDKWVNKYNQLGIYLDAFLKCSTHIHILSLYEDIFKIIVLTVPNPWLKRMVLKCL